MFWGGQNHLVYIGDSRVRQLYLSARTWAEAGGEQPGGDHREVGGALRLLWVLQHRLHADSLGEL